MDEAFDITDLALYPVKFAGKDIENALKARGHMFWKCRQRNYVRSMQVTSDVMQTSVSPSSLPQCHSRVLNDSLYRYNL